MKTCFVIDSYNPMLKVILISTINIFIGQNKSSWKVYQVSPSCLQPLFVLN